MGGRELTTMASGWTLLHRVITGVMVGLVLAAWVAMVAATRRGLLFEPTTEALERAAAAVPEGLFAAALFVATVSALTLWTRRGWLAVLALPGLVVGVTLVAAPHASAFVLGLLSTVLAVIVALALGLRDLLAQRHQARWQGSRRVRG